MAFNLTAELQLQANQQNINQVVGQIQNQLAPLGNVTVNVKTNAKAVQQAANQVQRLDKGLRSSQKSASELNRTLVESARRFSVITVATGSLLSLVNAFKNSVKSALDFEVELAKISQVTGKTVKELGDLSGEVRKLSRELGVGNQELLNTSRILLQTGISAEKTKQALDVLARTTLAATFDNIQDTTEGAIALLNQFGAQAKRTGQDIAFLEQSLDAINAVSKKFAVESSDLIGVVRRVGGVFSAAGGDVNELIALFTSVRQTTRESAETISTGLRTIFTRLQRTDTVDALKDLNIQLLDSQGKFVGAFEAVKRLSIGLSALDPKDFRFSAIVEELGGFRQVGKVIPLIKQFAVAQNALNVAQGASGSIVSDSITAQKTLANRFAKTREKFDELIAQFADSSSFRSLANGFLTIADSLIKIGSALEPVLPLLTALFALKVGSGLASGIGLLRGFSGGGGGGNPIVASRFATGGPVPGSGDRDTVPAMLTPGEFVIRKSSVKKIGMNNLAQMNAKGYARGGSISINESIGQVIPEGEARNKTTTKGLTVNVASLRKGTSSAIQSKLEGLKPTDTVEVNQKDVQTLALNKEFNKKTILQSGFDAINKSIKAAIPSGFGRRDQKKIEDDSNVVNTLGGFAFERFAGALLGATQGGDKDPFDFKDVGNTPRLDKIAKAEPFPRFIDAKNKEASANEIARKALRETSVQKTFKRDKRTGKRDKKALGGLIQKFNAGGAVQSILGQNKVGAVNLDVGKDNDVKLDVTLAQVNATQTAQKNNALKNKAGVRKYLNSKGKSKPPSYTLKRKSLDEKTGDQFRKVLVDELVKGVDVASSRLGQDLIGQPVKATDTAIEGIREKFKREGGAVGTVYEDVLNVAANKGDFAPSSLFQPFDFPNGLEPPLVDNFTGVPNAFVDARKAQNSKDRVSFERKIANQIALEADASEFGKLPSSVTGSKKAQKAALGGMIKKFARGGAASDTVPAMLTPGEFVLNKKAAQGIGSAKLDAMNKRGEVKGFNKGGAVQYLRRGGGPQQGPGLNDQGQSILPTQADKILDVFNKVGDSLAKVGVKGEALAKSQQAAATALSNGASEADAFKAGLDSLKDASKKTNAELKQEAAAKRQARKDLGQADSRNKIIQERQPAGATDADGNSIGGQFTGRRLAVADQSKRETLQTKFGPNAGGRVSGEGVASLTNKFDQFASSDKGAGASTAQRKAASDAGVKEFLILIKKGVPAQKAFNASIKKTETELDKYKSITKRINERTLEAARIKDEEIKASQDLINQKKKEEVESSRAKKPIGERLKGGFKGAREKVGAGLRKASQFGGQASQGFSQATSGGQNLVFAGAAIAAVTSQLGLFDKATEKAVTQSAAFAASTVGLVGSIGQTVAGFTNSAVASQNSAISDTEEAAASKAAANADAQKATTGAKFGKALGGFAIGVSLGISALQFFAAKNKAVAEENAKVFKDSLAKIRESGENNSATLISAARQETEARALAANQLSSSSVATVAGFTAAGAAIGSFIPVIGTFVGALIGAAIGVAAAMGLASRQTEAEIAASQNYGNALNQNIVALSGLAAAAGKANKELSDIESEVGISEDEKRRKTRNVVVDQQNALDNQKFKVGNAAELKFNRDKGESEFVETGPVSASKALTQLADISGKTVAELKALEGAGLAKAFEGKQQFNTETGEFDSKTSQVDAEKLAKSFQVIQTAIAERAKVIEKNEALTSENLSQELANVTPGKSFA